MSTQTLNPTAYGKLLAKVLPHAIKDEGEYDRFVSEAGRLMGRGEHDLTPEETSLLEVMSILIEEYDRKHYELLPSEPHQMLAFLMEQRGLEAAALTPILGSKSRVSDVLEGKHPLRKVETQKLADFFHVSFDLLI